MNIDTSGIDVSGLAVWLPGRGIAVGPLDLHVEGLTLLTGTSGSGGSAVAAALAGRLPAGALLRGRLGLDRVRVHSLVGPVTEAPFDITVGEVLGRDDAAARAFSVPVLAGFGALAPAPDDLVSEVSEPVRATLAVLRVLLAAEADLRTTAAGRRVFVILDQPLSAVTPAVRSLLAACIRRCADAGADVLWVEHDLAVAVPVADRVIELLADGDTWCADAAVWTPRHLPLPPQAALARALGLSRDRWFDLDALGVLPEVRAGLSRGPRRAVLGGLELPSTTRHGAQSSRTGLPFDVTLAPGETLGVVPCNADRSRALHVALRIAASTDDEPRPRPAWEWPSHLPVSALARRWAARGGAADVALADLASPEHGRSIRIDVRRTLAQHSTGERRLAEGILARHSTRTEVLDQPERGLDPAGQRLLAARLLDVDPDRPDDAPARIVVSHDPDFLVRACHRLLVLTEDGGAVWGRTALMAEHLPDAPALRRAGSKALRVRDLSPQFSTRTGIDKEFS